MGVKWRKETPPGRPDGACTGVAAPVRTNSTHSLPNSFVPSKYYGWKRTGLVLHGQDVYRKRGYGYAIERDGKRLVGLSNLERTILGGILKSGLCPDLDYADLAHLDGAAASHAADQWDNAAKERSRCHTAETGVF